MHQLLLLCSITLKLSLHELLLTCFGILSILSPLLLLLSPSPSLQPHSAECMFHMPDDVSAAISSRTTSFSFSHSHGVSLSLRFWCFFFDLFFSFRVVLSPPSYLSAVSTFCSTFGSTPFLFQPLVHRCSPLASALNHLFPAAASVQSLPSLHRVCVALSSSSHTITSATRFILPLDSFRSVQHPQSANYSTILFPLPPPFPSIPHACVALLCMLCPAFLRRAPPLRLFFLRPWSAAKESVQVFSARSE
jgi:hypothetical protein